MSELQEVIDNIMSLPLEKKAYVAEILLRDIDAEKSGSAVISGRRTVGEYEGKIEMSRDFSAPLPDEFWVDDSDETAT